MKVWVVAYMMPDPGPRRERLVVKVFETAESAIEEYNSIPLTRIKRYDIMDVEVSK